MDAIELTVGDVAERIGITSDAARKRLNRHGYKSSRYIGVNAMFKLTSDDLEFLKLCDKRGAAGHKKKQPKKAKKKPTKKT